MSQIYPVLEPRTLSRQVWDAASARAIPGVSKALNLIAGLTSQMPLDDFRGIQPLPRPRLLEQPDLDLVRSVFVLLHIEDFLLHGNAAHLVTARDRSTGLPAAVKWYPAHAWGITDKPGEWYLHGKRVPDDDVIHVQHGADPVNPRRGVGLIERHIRSLDRVALQEETERQNLVGGGVPSAAVIAPQKELTETELDEAGAKWEEKFRGPGRRPAIFPNGTQVVPLAWSPNDQQATLARQLSLTDVANIFGLDGYWLGAPGSSHTYRSPGPLFLMLLRTTIDTVLAPFEDTWSLRWLPRGRKVVFDRAQVLGDDMATTIKTLTTATGGRPVLTVNEARAVLKRAPVEGGDELPAEPVAQPAPDDEPDPDDDEKDEREESAA